MPKRTHVFQEDIIKEFNIFKQVRADVMKALEEARSNQVIGSSQEAYVKIFIKDEKTRTISLTDEGSHKCEKTFKIDNPEKYRRIIVGLSENPATLFIKFADRLHNLRTLRVHDEVHQKYIIDETVKIYIPIAHRLGMKKMKSEMEDLCLQYSETEQYNKVLDLLTE